MAKDYSFDVVCRTDLQEAANAVNQASKEIRLRRMFRKVHRVRSAAVRRPDRRQFP